jgi:Molecular chaperone, HSP90 family
MSFEHFDPLRIPDRQAVEESLLRDRQKRNIYSILHSYVGWYDPFSELIQNALDSVDKRGALSSPNYKKRISIRIDAETNSVTVSDNGLGLDEASFEQFLAPNVSFKDATARGSKGVGATYLAYGFNYLRVDTKTKNFVACGEMEGGRNWLHDPAAPQNPHVYPTTKDAVDPTFAEFDSGASVTVSFDPQSRPSDLAWPNLNSAQSWAVALQIKTALGAILETQTVDVLVTHVSRVGGETSFRLDSIRYLGPHTFFSRVKRYEEVIERLERNVQKLGANASIPGAIKNLDAVYLEWHNDEILKHVDLSAEQRAFLVEHPVRLIGSYMYSARVWEELSKKIGCRPNANIFNPGIQLAADNMPQGEIIQVPLRRYTGRQNQVHFMVHFSNCVVDLGRKGFHKDFVDVAKHLAQEIVQRDFSKVKGCLRVDDFRRTGIIEQEKLNSWKQMLSEHEKAKPLLLRNDNFFKPIHEVSVTAEPSREQDVIALFNQLVAGGVIRGVKVIGTNELMTYDGAYRVVCGPNYDNHQYHPTENPLGIGETQKLEFEDAFPEGFLSTEMKILEYKFSVDGFISDITTGDKKVRDVDLLIAWEFGTEHEQFFSIQSLLVPEGESHRQYHGITHLLFDEHGNHALDAIILKDLIAFLNDTPGESARQVDLYE